MFTARFLVEVTSGHPPSLDALFSRERWICAWNQSPRTIASYPETPEVKILTRISPGPGSGRASITTSKTSGFGLVSLATRRFLVVSLRRPTFWSPRDRYAARTWASSLSLIPLSSSQIPSPASAMKLSTSPG